MTRKTWRVREREIVHEIQTERKRARETDR